MSNSLDRHSGHPLNIPIGAAWAAFGVGTAYAGISAYWGAGGMWLLPTVGGVFEKWGHSGGAGVLLLQWSVVVVKVIAAALPLLAIYGLGPISCRKVIQLLAWIDGSVMAVYGLIWTASGLAVQAGIVRVPPHADHRALRWHAFLWDPWFLIWGLLIIVALSSRKFASNTERRRVNFLQSDA